MPGLSPPQEGPRLAPRLTQSQATGSACHGGGGAGVVGLNREPVGWGGAPQSTLLLVSPAVTVTVQDLDFPLHLFLLSLHLLDPHTPDLPQCLPISTCSSFLPPRS